MVWGGGGRGAESDPTGSSLRGATQGWGADGGNDAGSIADLNRKRIERTPKKPRKKKPLLFQEGGLKWMALGGQFPITEKFR